MKKHFVTFASSDLYRSLLRIGSQAEDMGVYDSIAVSNELDLDHDFRERYKSKLVKGSRGYGYWCWKPQIILQKLREVDDGDIVHYVDAGCHVNKDGVPRLLEYFRIAESAENGILAFQAIPPPNSLIFDDRKFESLPDYKWAKGDLIDYFGCRGEQSIINTPTIGAGVILIKKCDNSIRIIKEWADVVDANFSLIDDSPSVSPNVKGFRENRHDQAIFSLVCKRNGVSLLSAYEYWYPSKKNNSKPDWNVLEKYPVQAKRDKDFGLARSAALLFSRAGKALFKMVNSKKRAG